MKNTDDPIQSSRDRHLGGARSTYECAVREWAEQPIGLPLRYLLTCVGHLIDAAELTSSDLAAEKAAADEPDSQDEPCPVGLPECLARLQEVNEAVADLPPSHIASIGWACRQVAHTCDQVLRAHGHQP